MKKQSVCFAYFGDNTFLGWYADSFGSIRPHSPKVYSSLENMLPIITKNFQSKVAEARAGQDIKVNIPHPIGAAIVNAGLTEDAKQLAEFKEVVLKAVACPHYDGPNPDFDKEAYDKEVEAYNERFHATGIGAMPTGIDRFHAVQEFQKTSPHPKADNWIYVDYALVSEWAKNEPTEFLTVITEN